MIKIKVNNRNVIASEFTCKNLTNKRNGTTSIELNFRTDPDITGYELEKIQQYIEQIFYNMDK